MKKQFKLLQGDNMISLKKLPDNSIDSIVSDPPYGLSFMGKKWDYDVPSVEFWKEVYRVLKPGGHVLSFGGTRTYHRMVVNIEDAGFEIRDQIMWIYGSGFPKSHNIGKAVDKLQGNEREVVGKEELKERSTKKVEDASSVFMPREYDYTKGTTEHEGWGTALKPANEPICVARKPLSEKTIAENVLKWGTGGINIDGCRIETDEWLGGGGYNNKGTSKKAVDDATSYATKVIESEFIQPEGRFPANIIFDESAAQMLDEQSGISTTKCVAGKVDKTAGIFQDAEGNPTSGHKAKVYPTSINDKGGASRFFYIPKVSKSERNMGLDGFEDKTIHDDDNKYGIDKFNTLPKKNHHPTLKPVQLMAYLCRLVTPPNGIVLDPFMGSGSTGISALLEGFRFCGMEMSEEYFKIAEARIENYELYRPFTEKKKKK